MRERLLLTGATGFLGSYLLGALLRRGYQVTVLKRRSSSTWRIDPYLSQVAVLEMDGTPVPEACRTAGPFDAIVHPAACFGRRGESLAVLLEANLLLGAQLLDYAISSACPVFINVGTSLPRAHSSYAMSKHQFAEWGSFVGRTWGLRFYNLRLEHLYGAGDDETRFPSYVIRQCVRDAGELRLTEGRQRRDFVHISDAVGGCLALLSAALADNAAPGDYPLGSGQAVTIREFVELVHRLAGSRTRIQFGAVPYRADEAMSCEADCTALRRLGWEPRVGLQEGLAQLVEDELVRCGRSVTAPLRDAA